MVIAKRNVKLFPMTSRLIPGKVSLTVFMPTLGL